MAHLDTNEKAPIEIGAQDWLLVRQLLARHMPGWEVWAFGSRVCGNAKPFSDLDLAVRAPHVLSLEDLARINDVFDSSNLTIKVDVVDLRAVSEAFKAQVDGHKVLLQT